MYMMLECAYPRQTLASTLDPLKFCVHTADSLDVATSNIYEFIHLT